MPKIRENRLPGKEVRSPYIVRCLNPKSSPNKKQMQFAAYLRSTEKMPLTSLFKCGDIVTTNEDVRSLVIQDSFVLTNVISTYSYILNYRERYKSQSSPSRVFFPIEVTNKLVLFDDYEKSYDTFKSDMDIYFERWSTFKNLQLVDLFFFPFYIHEHFFVACFNLQSSKKRYDFLDNKPEGGSSLEKYEDLSSKLRAFFSKWLTTKKAPHKALLVSCLEPSRPQMKWLDESNDCDCAIYTMRHMETYQGDLKEWDAGLEKGKFKALKNLRIKYAYDIVAFEKNELKSEVFSVETR
ncbi:hypothetical protein vseg_016054 [Gypsophila vaccaria]